MKKEKYQIVVGETGNDFGHITDSSHVSDAAAIRKAKRMCAEYNGDGWWIVRDMTGGEAKGGKR